MDPVQTGVLGCGTISDNYLGKTDYFDSYEIIACADLEMEKARTAADEYDLLAYEPDELLADETVELIINLTPPSVHHETCLDSLNAGKHVYVEKPLAASFEEGQQIIETAAAADLLVGSAPDTFLGAGLQTVRSVVDNGRIGDPVGATAVWAAGGHENWHPNPDIYYKHGGGPLFDMGPYYVTALVSVLGAISRVSGATARTYEQRTITSEPRHGELIDVEVPTHESGVFDFENGAIATVMMSFDAPGDSTLSFPAFELYGTEGTLRLPNPNNFEGPVKLQSPDGEIEDIPLTHEYTDGRGIGVADLAHAIREDWSHRTNGYLALHVLESLDGLRKASETGSFVPIETSISRPKSVPKSFPVRRGAN